MTLTEQVALTLTEGMKKTGYSKSRLSRDSGVPLRTIQRITNNADANVKVGTLEKLLKTLKIKLIWKPE